MDDLTPELKKNEPSKRLTKSSPEYQKWIAQKLAEIAVMLGEDISPARLSLTVIELADIKPGKLQKALKVARKKLKFFPKPAEIYEIVRDLPPRLLRPGENMPQPGDPDPDDVIEIPDVIEITSRSRLK